MQSAFAFSLERPRTTNLRMCWPRFERFMRSIESGTAALVRAELQGMGLQAGKHRVARLMRDNGIRARPLRRFRKTTDSGHKLPVAPNILQREFGTTAPNQVWAGDITYNWTNEGWAYLAVLLALYSRRVIGWSLRKSLSSDLALSALRHAITQRRPLPGLVHHTDRGCQQYASSAYGASWTGMALRAA